MIMSKTKLNTLISLCAVGLALLTGATTAIANDSDRISLLEKEVQALKLRLANLESPQSTPSNRPRVVATKDGWKSLANWRSLKKGMNPDEVRSVLDEPANVRASGPLTDWNYSNRGTVTFYEERLHGWTEPR
jgi:hypothetical protein